jgi:hypothetical protein
MLLLGVSGMVMLQMVEGGSYLSCYFLV